jgi:cytoskeletal protein RodZ
MLLSLKCRLGLLVWLLFTVQFAAALDARFLRRQDEGSTSASTDTESGAEPTTSSDVDPEQTVSSTLSEEEDPEPTTRATATATSTNDERSATSTTAIAISTNGTLDDSNFLNGMFLRAC